MPNRRQADVPADSSFDMQAGDLDVDESLPLELAESMAALDAFGSYERSGSVGNVSGTNGFEGARALLKEPPSPSGASAEDNENGGADTNDLEIPAAGKGSESVLNVDDEGDDDKHGRLVVASAATPTVPSAASSPSPPREKEPTMVMPSVNDDCYTTTDDDDTAADADVNANADGDAGAVGDHSSFEDGQSSTATDDAIDFMHMNMNAPAAVRDQEDEEKEAEEVDQGGEAEPAELNTTGVIADALDNVVLVGSDLADEEDDIVRTDTDDLSGISDPINDLSRSPTKSLRSEEGASPDVAETLEEIPAPAGLDESGTDHAIKDHQETVFENGVNDAPDSGEVAVQAESAVSGNANGDVEDTHLIQGNERSSTPPSTNSPTEPVSHELDPETPATKEDASHSAAFSNDVGRYWSNKTVVSEDVGAKERPSAWLSKILCDESLIPVDIDADRIIMEEDSDLKPWAQEPELDGEPLFLYGSIKKQQRAAAAAADGGTAAEPVGDASGSRSAGSVESAPLMPKFPPESATTKPRSAEDPPGKPPLPLHEQEKAPAPGLATSSPEPNPMSSAASSASSSDIASTNALKPSKQDQSMQSEVNDLPLDASPLPDATPILASGPILTRSSLRSLVMKKWHTSHWVRYGPTTLLVFRTEDDFDNWLRNPYHSQRQRDYLVKARLDFSSEMKKPDVRGFKMTEMKSKAYEKKGVPMHNFKT